MKKLILLLLAGIGIGCASIHERCSDPRIVSRYRDYNQCYAELSAEQERWQNQQQQYWQNYNQQLQNTTHEPIRLPASQSTSCTSSVIGNQIYTNCN